MDPSALGLTNAGPAGNFAGALISFQAGANAQLAHWLHSPFRAALANFVIGTIELLVLAVAAAVVPPYPRRTGSPRAVVGLSRWLFRGVLRRWIDRERPEARAATLIALAVAGRTVASLLVDQSGRVGFAERHISRARIGMLLLLGGVTFVRVF